MTAHFYTNPTGHTVSADDVALEHIRRMAHRLLSDDDINSPPSATMPALPVFCMEGRG